MKRILALLAFVIYFLASPITTLAVDGTFLIPSWVDPTPSRSYLFTDSVVVNGTWQLPPDWAGNIYVYMDAPVDGGGNLTGEGTQKTDLNTGNPYYSVSNAGGLASTSGMFSFNAGTQPDGAHNVYIKFVGGQQCAVNKQLNSQYGTNYAPVCDITAENLLYVVWAPRDFNVGLPPYPRMVLTPSTTPAYNYANVVFGTSLTQVFTIENTGGQTLTGSISNLSAPFSCSPCGYTVNPSGTAFINITYTPQSIGDIQNQLPNFSCIGSSYGCDGQPYNGGTPTYQIRNIVGNSVANVTPPQLLVVSPASVNYGTINLNGIPNTTKTIVVKNNGGGILNGNVTYSSVEYTCLGNPTCAFSLLSGQSTTITVSYTPTIAGTHNDTSTVTSNAGNSSPIPISSIVNDLPIVRVIPPSGSISNTGSWYAGSNINVGSCVNSLLTKVYVSNSGAGMLSGQVEDLPNEGFDCISGCTYTNIASGATQEIVFRFCPTAAGTKNTVARLTNILNPSAEGSVNLSGNGNNLPIGAIIGLGNFPFGNVLVGATTTRSITVQNTGVGNLSGSVSALPYPEYTCTFGCPYNIPPGGTQVITLQFIPTAVQTYNGAVVLTCTTCVSGIIGSGPVSITGTGVKPNFQMSYSGSPVTTCPGTTCVTDIPQTPPRDAYDVGQTTYGGALAVQNKKFYLYIANKGSGANVNYTMPSTAHFVCLGITAPCTGTIPGGSSYTVTYEFQPSAATSYSEPLTVNYDYGDGTPRSVILNLSGSSVAMPYLSIFPNGNIDLGNVSVGNTATATFTVTNLGSGNLNGNVTIPTPGAVAPTLNLIRHWTFDDANTNWTTHVTYDTQSSRIANLPGPISAAGQYNEALNFTGRGGMRVNAVTGLTSGNIPVTMAAWIKVNALGPQRQWIALLGNEGGSSLHWLIQTNGITQFGVWGGAQTQPVLPVGTWVHVTMTYDGTTLKSYVNGVLSQSISASVNILGNPPPLTIGWGRIGGSESDFNGLIDDFRVYKRALSATDVTKVYNHTFSDTTDLVGLYTFDDPTVVWSQLKVTDGSSKVNDGVLSAVPVSVSGKVGQALNFTGQYDQELTTVDFFNNPQDFTIATWFKTTSASGKKIIGFENASIGNSGSYDRQLWMGTDGKIRFGIYNGGTWVVTSSALLNDGNWHQAVGTHDASGATKLYIDGVLQGTLTAVAQNYGGYWRIGGNRLGTWPNGSDGYFIGSLDEAYIYSRALSASEVSDLYGAGVAAGASAFTCVSGCTITGLPYNATQDVKIEFKPTLAQGYIAYPSFLTDGGNIAYPTAPYPSVTGTGVLDPIISVNPASIIFPDTNQGLYTNQTIVISNTGAGNLSGNVSPVKTPGLSFYCLSGCNYNIPAGGSANATIQFAPQSVATLNSNIILNSNAINGQQIIPVSGRGILAPIIALSGADTNYGPVIVGKYKDLTFTVANAGTASLGSGFFDMTGPFVCVSPVDPFDGLCHYNIGPGDSVTVTIRFQPTVVGPASGAVWLSGTPLARFIVSGIGVSPTVKFIEQ